MASDALPAIFTEACAVLWSYQFLHRKGLSKILCQQMSAQEDMESTGFPEIKSSSAWWDDTEVLLIRLRDSEL